MRVRKLIVLSIFIFSFFSCKNEVKTQHTEGASHKNTTDKQLNITILLDLSDRIEPTKYPSSPEHFERDIEIVNYFTEIFKADIKAKGTFTAKGKIKVIFSPKPEDSQMNEIASNLSVDLSKISTGDKKKVYANISKTFKENLSKIYAKTIKTKKYPGSDIWRFFKNDVVDYCVHNNKAYRNILVLITDGYIYHKNSTDKNKNRTASLLPKDIEANGLREPDWKQKIESQDFGYITTRNDLNNLDVLVLEINPLEQYKNDEDILKAYLSKWFKEMNVNSFKLYNSDLPEYTKSRIDNFISQ